MLPTSNLNHVPNIGICETQTTQSEDYSLNNHYNYLATDVISVVDYPINYLSDSISNNYLLLSSNNYNASTFINDVLDNRIDESNISIDITGITADYDIKVNTDIRTNFPLFFKHKNKIKVPCKIEYALKRFTPKGLLKAIHPNLDVSVELCLLFTTQLSSTYFEMLDNSSSDGWKALKTEYLREFLSTSSSTYKNIRIALEAPLKKGAILECDHFCKQGSKSYHYRLGDAYIKRGIVSYELKTPEAIKLLNKRYLKSYKLSNENLICKNLIEFYSSLTLPTIDQIKKEAKRLIKMDYMTNKGKKLTFLHKHPRSYFKSTKCYSFVEDAIEIYQYLTDHGLMIPTQGNEPSGGRVIDSFTLMPSWIRRMVKVEGHRTTECDYSCLHPNIALALYGGKQEYLTHGKLASASGINDSTVKIEHLSFFNKQVWQMKKSPLFNYYMEHEPHMMLNIINEKQSSEFKHKITSRRMFETEVTVMTDVIRILNKEGIYVGYVYDALLCHPKLADRVKEVMDEIVLKHSIKTTVKLPTGKKFNSIVHKHLDKYFEIGAIKMPDGFTAFLEDDVPDLMTHNLIPEQNTNAILQLNASEIYFSTRIKESINKQIESGTIPNFVDAIIHFDDGCCYEEKVVRFKDPISYKHQYITLSYLNGTAAKLLARDSNFKWRHR